MVDKVEGFSPELEPSLLVDGEVLEQAEIPVLVSGLIDEVANTLSVERTRSRLGKNRRTVGIGGSEPLALGPKGADDFGVAVYDPILAVHAASEVRVEAHARCGRCLRR